METGRINTPVSFSSILLISCWCSALAGRQGHPLMAFIQVSLPGHGAGWSTAERGSAGAHGRYLIECGSCQIFFFVNLHICLSIQWFCFHCFLISLGSCPVQVFFPCQYFKVSLILLCGWSIPQCGHSIVYLALTP